MQTLKFKANNINTSQQTLSKRKSNAFTNQIKAIKFFLMLKMATKLRVAFFKTNNYHNA